jgi:hypothetical protein
LRCNHLKYQEQRTKEHRPDGGEKAMDNSMRMVIIAGVLMLALLIAIVGSVSADVPIWQTTASVLGSTNQPL